MKGYILGYLLMSLLVALTYPYKGVGENLIFYIVEEIHLGLLEKRGLWGPVEVSLAIEGDLFLFFMTTWSGVLPMVILFLIFVVWGSFFFIFPFFLVEVKSISYLLFFLTFWYGVEVKWIVFFLFIALQVLGSMNYINNLVSLILLFTIISFLLWLGYLLDFLSFILLSLYVGGVLILFLTVIKLLGVEKRDINHFWWVPIFLWSGIFVMVTLYGGEVIYYFYGEFVDKIMVICRFSSKFCLWK